jgi:hypothetical protein
MMALAKTQIGQLRIRLTGKSAREVAKQIDMTLRRYRALELEELRGTPEERQKIADALGVKTWELG